MKKHSKYSLVSILFAVLLFASCSDYLDIKPKKVKVPTTVEDYRAFLENPNLVTSTGNDMRSYLINEFWNSASVYNAGTLNRINYLWINTEDRIGISETDEVYNVNYNSIYYTNLIINDVPKLEFKDPSQLAQADTLVAQAKVKRALHYFYLINTYSKMYDPATAATDGGVPIITTADDMETVFPQRSVADVYKLILDDLNSAIPLLPNKVASFHYPTLASGYALLARVQLFMGDFENALINADKSLQMQNFIFDMVAYHKTYVKEGKSIQGVSNGTLITALPAVTKGGGVDENLLMVYAEITHAISGYYARYIAMKDGAGAVNYARDSTRFEPGDTRFSCYYYRNTASQRFEYKRMEAINSAGLRTTEVYLMRAECYARKGELGKAMDDLNAIRKKRIINYLVPEVPSTYTYQDKTASTVAEAIDLIRHERDVELLGSTMMFFDMRRFNREPDYRRTMIKVDENGVTRTLEPDSPLWIMPFPSSVTNYNNTIKQNTTI